MATAKTHTWTPTTENGFMNTELDNIWEAINGGSGLYAPLVHTHVEADITDLQTYALDADLTTAEGEIDTLQTNEEFYYIAAQMFSTDSGATNPAVWNASLAGGRLAAWTIPTGTTNIFMWHEMPMPPSWSGSGKKVKTTVYYKLTVAGAASENVVFLSSGYGYDSGDADTSPTVAWNEGVTIDVSALSADTIYSQAWTEAGATLGTEEFIGIRLNVNRANASYTYTGGAVEVFAVKLELV
jgi:hypothetical protein